MLERKSVSAQAPEAFTDDELARAAVGSGLSVEELRAALQEHPMTDADLEDATRFAKRVREGREKLTYLKP
jgi:hypothetical protein